MKRRRPSGLSATISSALTPKRAHAARQRFRIVSEILRDLGSDIKTDHECTIISRPQRLTEKFDCRFLLELKAFADGVAGIDQQPHLQRQIGFVVEAANLCRRLAVINHIEIVPLQIFDIAPVFVRDCENDVDFVHRNTNGCGGLIVERHHGRRWADICRLRLRV